MTNIKYALVEEKYIYEDTARVSYGIAAYANTEHGCGDIVLSVHDITSDRTRLSELVESCNRLKLSTLHLNDVIEDFFVV